MEDFYNKMVPVELDTNWTGTAEKIDPNVPLRVDVYSNNEGFLRDLRRSDIVNEPLLLSEGSVVSFSLHK